MLCDQCWLGNIAAVEHMWANVDVDGDREKTPSETESWTDVDMYEVVIVDTILSAATSLVSREQAPLVLMFLRSCCEAKAISPTTSHMTGLRSLSTNLHLQ